MFVLPLALVAMLFIVWKAPYQGLFIVLAAPYVTDYSSAMMLIFAGVVTYYLGNMWEALK